MTSPHSLVSCAGGYHGRRRYLLVGLGSSSLWLKVEMFLCCFLTESICQDMKVSALSSLCSRMWLKHLSPGTLLDALSHWCRPFYSYSFSRHLAFLLFSLPSDLTVNLTVLLSCNGAERTPWRLQCVSAALLLNPRCQHNEMAELISRIFLAQVFNVMTE